MEQPVNNLEPVVIFEDSNERLSESTNDTFTPGSELMMESKMEPSNLHNVLQNSSEISNNRAMKIADPERRSTEFISNGFTGCNVEDVLEEKSSKFINSRKQIIILTAAGKPVYCYGRPEDDLANITGIIMAIDSNFLSMGETLKSVKTKKGFFVFEKIGSLLYFCYSPMDCTTVFLIHEEFQLIHQQLIMILSMKAMNILDRNKNYDIRELLGNSSGNLTTLITHCDLSLYYILRCYRPLLLKSNSRGILRDMFLSIRHPDTIYCGLGINESIIICLQDKRFSLSPMNQVLLQMIITKTIAFRSSEGWLPICITDVSNDKFLHLYVGFVTDEMYVFFVTTGNDPDTFSVYSLLKDRIYDSLLSSDRLISLYSHYNESITVTETGIPDLIHFVYKNDSSQVLIPKLDERVFDFHNYQAFIKQFQLIYSHMAQNQLSEYYESSSDWIIHATKKDSSFYIIVVSPYLSCNDVTKRRQMLTEWLYNRMSMIIQQDQLFF